MKLYLYFFKPMILCDWFDFGLMLKIYKTTKNSDYYFAIDIQIAWFNLFLQCWKKKIKNYKKWTKV